MHQAKYLDLLWYYLFCYIKILKVNPFLKINNSYNYNYNYNFQNEKQKKKNLKNNFKKNESIRTKQKDERGTNKKLLLSKQEQEQE